MGITRESRSWWIIAAVAVGIYGVLALFVRVAPDNSFDRTVVDWVSGWDVAILDTTMERVSWFTDLRPRLVLGLVGVVGITLSGRHRLAAGIVAVSAVAAIVVNGVDLVGGIVADRIRPNGAPFLAYPSGHTLGTVIQYGFAIYLTLRLGLHRRFLTTIVVLLALPIVLVGPARVVVGAHWSTDILGAYLLGAGAVIALVLLLEIAERWLNDRKLLNDSAHPAPAHFPAR